MEIIKYILLGLLQGFTEPLPISSSGHIFIFKSIFNTALFEDLNFEIFLNFASFISIIFIFRKDIKKLIEGFINNIKYSGRKGKEEFDYCIKILIGTIPVGIVSIRLLLLY